MGVVDDEMDAIAASIGIKANITSFSDNIDAYTKIQQVGGQVDLVSGDALWVPHYYETNLIDPFDINSLKVSSQLFSIARSFSIWTSPAGYLGYPNGWAPIQITYDPAHVTSGADSTTVPAISWPGVIGQLRLGKPPLTKAWSVPHTPHALTAMRTWSGGGDVVSTSVSLDGESSW